MNKLTHIEGNIFSFPTEYDTGYGLIEVELYAEIHKVDGYYPEFTIESLWRSDPDKPDHDYWHDLSDYDQREYEVIMRDAIIEYQREALELWADINGEV